MASYGADKIAITINGTMYYLRVATNIEAAHVPAVLMINNHACILHREDGPAVIYASGCLNWYIHGYLKTDEIVAWQVENDIPEWKDWTVEDQVLFRLRWS